MTKRALALLLCSIACSPSESNDPAPTKSGAVSETVAAPAPAGPADFTEADLDAYERGIAKEIELVKAARDRGARASTPAERSAAAQAEWEDATIPAAAQAAGIAADRYRGTRKAVHTVFETLDFQGKIDGPLEMDLARADEATKARLARDPFDALTPAAASALRARMNRLLPLWKEYATMTALYG